MVLIYKVYDLLLRDHLAIDSHSLTEVAQVGRGKQTGTIACLLQDRGEHMRYRALAIGAGNVDRKVVTLRITQVATEGCHTLQSWFVSTYALLLKRGH